MKLIDADKLPYSNIKTNEYGYVETTKIVVLEEDIANAQTVKAIPLDKVKRLERIYGKMFTSIVVAITRLHEPIVMDLRLV